MVMAAINDYLAKQIFIEKNVVTFRSLSRQFNIHVNEAKNALQAYHDASQTSVERSYATFLLSGEANVDHTRQRTRSPDDEDGMDVDDGDLHEPSSDSDGETVPSIKMVLVGEKDMEGVKSNFSRIYSQHVYCLSPAPLVDPSLIGGPSAQIQSKDAGLSVEASTSLGRITGPNVVIGKRLPPRTDPAKPIARTSTKEEVKEKPKVAAKASKPSEAKPIKPEPKESKLPPIPKAKSSGKLDWSKAKVKAKEDSGSKSERSESVDSDKPPTTMKIGPPRGVKPSAKAKSSMKDTFFGPKRGASKTDTSDTSPPQSKRGIKRKSVHESSDSEDLKVPPSSSSPAPERDPTPPPKKSVSRVKKGTVLSDDEGETTDTSSIKRPKVVKPKGRRLSKRQETEEEKSLKAMMDIDDDEVVKASRPQKKKILQEEDPTDEDVSMEDDIDFEPEPEPEPVKTKPRKKKEKKEVPRGQNGLKKKRIIKSRSKLDEKGYMVFEDYSEYESVDEEEPEEPKPRKGKKAATKETKPEAPAKSETKPPKPKPKPLEKAESRKAKPAAVKRTGSAKAGASRNGSLMSFFEKK